MNCRPIESVPPLPTRERNAHKGDVGRVLIIAGQMNEFGMAGAAALVANAALRSGAGLVQVVTQEAAQPIVAMLAPCVTTRRLDPDKDLATLAREFSANVVAIGPGLGSTVTDRQVIQLIDAFDGPLVIDADGLNVLAAGPAWSASEPGQIVVTPHPGEMQRLLNGLGLQADPGDRAACAVAVAGATRSVVVLKGAGTVVTDGTQIYLNATGNAGMATAGSGDVLTGIIAALAGQGMTTLDAAILGVYLHGVAGDLAAASHGTHGLIATDLIEYLPPALQSQR